MVEAIEVTEEKATDETTEAPAEEIADESTEESTEVPVDEETEEPAAEVEEETAAAVEAEVEVEEAPVAEAPAVEAPAVEAPAVEAPAAEAEAEVEEAPVAEAPAVEAPAVEAAVDEAPVEEPPVSPFDLPGDWYVIHSYSGYENKVKVNLESRIQSMHMEDRIYEVHIPMEDIVEIKAGKKVTVNKKVFPGYILVRMSLDDDSWYAVRNTPGVTGFVAGNAQKPTPLSRREVERFLGVQKEEEKGKPRFKPDWEIGEQVRVVTGPFADFNGVIEEINIDQQKIVVLVNIFGRDTPVELGFDDIQKS
jgi:transcriptional antiterminator NusG